MSEYATELEITQQGLIHRLLHYEVDRYLGRPTVWELAQVAFVEGILGPRMKAQFGFPLNRAQARRWKNKGYSRR